MSNVIVWVDSDPKVDYSILTSAGFLVHLFNDVLPAMELIRKEMENLTCVITSTMKRGGRAEKGLPSGFDLADFIFELYGERSFKPLLAFVTKTADKQFVLEKGFSIYKKVKSDF
jgi:hypothetical protein